MKDTEFIELLNLYLDHEISASDAARLEEEVHGNPARHLLYQDYCRMQKACRLLARDFAGEDAEHPERKIVAFETAQSARARRNMRYAAGAFVAAAACLALVFAGYRSRSAGPQRSDLAQSQRPDSAIAVSETHAPNAEGAQAIAVSMRSGEGADSAHSESLALGRRAPVPVMLGSPRLDPNFAWIQDVKLTPVASPATIDQLRFDVGPSLPPQNHTFTSGTNTVSPDIPWSAIRFQK